MNLSVTYRAPKSTATSTSELGLDTGYLDRIKIKTKTISNHKQCKDLSVATYSKTYTADRTKATPFSMSLF